MSLSNLLQPNSYELYARSMHTPDMFVTNVNNLPYIPGGATGATGGVGPSPSMNPAFIGPCSNSFAILDTPAYFVGSCEYGATGVVTTELTAGTTGFRIPLYSATLPNDSAFSGSYVGELQIRDSGGSFQVNQIIMSSAAIVGASGVTGSSLRYAQEQIPLTAAVLNTPTNTDYPQTSGNTIQYGLWAVTADAGIDLGTTGPYDYIVKAILEVPNIDPLVSLTFP